MTVYLLLDVYDPEVELTKYFQKAEIKNRSGRGIQLGRLKHEIRKEFWRGNQMESHSSSEATDGSILQRRHSITVRFPYATQIL